MGLGFVGRNSVGEIRARVAVVLTAVGVAGLFLVPRLSVGSTSMSAIARPIAASPAIAPAAAAASATAAGGVHGSGRPKRCGRGGVFCAGAATGDITPPITSPQWAYTARNCPEATAVDLSGHTQDPQNHIEEGQVYLLHGGPSCVAGKVSPDTDLYAKTWPPTDGTFGRLQANAYVLDDGKGQRIAIVQADLGGIPGELHTFVAKAIASMGIDQSHLLISATHDHGSVGGMWIGQGYALLGGDEYDPRVFDAVGTGIVTAITQANLRLTPARMAYGFGSVNNANHNRDTGSWSLDPEAKLGDTTNAPRLMVMRIDTTDGVPLGVISNYANHGVIHGTFNYYYSGDNQGSTTRMASRGIRAAAAAAGVKFPAGWTVVDSMINGAVGDITPVADDGGWPDSSFQTWGDASSFDDPNYMQFARMENGGMRQAPEAVRVWQSLGRSLSDDVTLDARFDYVCFCAQQVPDDPFDPYSHVPYVPANDDPAYDRVSVQAVLGGGGISDAPTLPGLPVTPPYPSGPCGLNCFPTTVVPSHHLERPTLMASAGVSPYNARVQVLRINDLALAGMPGEPTIEMGRRIERSILKAAPNIFHNALTIGLANDYVSYFPTIQEYEAYHYEGSFSLFGQQTGNVLKARLVHLAQLMQGGQPVEACTIDRACVTPPDTSFLALTPEPLVPDLNAGTVEAQPTPSMQRFGGTNFQWVGGGPGAEWNQGQPMVQVQSLVGGAWTTVASDMDTEVLLHYVKNGGLNHWEAFLDTTKDWPAGSYRFHVTGHYATGPATKAPYTLDSATFAIIPFANLQLVKVGTGNFEVQYPAPSPGITYRYREKLAVTATVNGTYPADFHLAPGQTLVIPVGGIRDAYGNYNGAPITVTG
jgi:neutral ceramidase